MHFVSGFLAAVPTANKQAYTDFSEKMVDYFKGLGATRVVECWGEDVPDGEVTSFPMAVKKQDDETVVFSWMEWPDKATCDAAMQKMMSDPELPGASEMPLDGKRMVFGGFQMIVDR
ncbi:MAG: RNA signal recognition particle [Ponticaulis sp.]|nr:RNA signal recognition particle [Ponticaulis sp.]|tara:strand:- start:8763 stop:9113 length:351 start_codon:yes stop_codon:yes gene_type:complete